MSTAVTSIRHFWVATGVRRFLRNKAKLSATTLGKSGDVNVHCHGRRDAARGGASGLQSLEFVQGLVEATLYAGLVARELGEGIGAVGVPAKVRPSAVFSASCLTLISWALRRASRCLSLSPIWCRHQP
jgi:hypothetical protein